MDSRLQNSTNSLAQALRHIYTLDFSPVIERMVRKQGWSRRSARRAVLQYRNFLALRRKYGNANQFIPSVDIDEVWHNHILFTAQYHRDCQTIFGDYVHHHPQALSPSSSVRAQLAEQYQQTQECYKSEFGEYIYAARGNWLVERVLQWGEFIANALRPRAQRMGWDHAATRLKNMP